MVSLILNVIAHKETLPVSTTNALEALLAPYAPLKTVLHPTRAFDYALTVADEAAFRAAVAKAAEGLVGADVLVHTADAKFRRAKKLFVFDMDSTLIYQEVIELIAAYADVEAQVEAITTQAMNGEIDFTESLAMRVRLLAGIPSTRLWSELKEKIELTNGARELCRALKRLGCVMAVCSGGFLPLAIHVKETLGLDYAFANQLAVDEATQTLAGHTVGEIVDGVRKAALLEQIASEHGIDVANAVAVGDGANDLLMMAKAGWGVAWNAKPHVQAQAQCRLNSLSLLDILYILGYSQSEVDELVK